MATRTRNGFYKHPSHVDGVVTFENESYPIAAGVVECPIEIGEGADWTHATPEEIAAHKAALAEPKGDDAPAKKKDKKAAEPKGDDA